jgi:MFS family permease
VPFRFIAGVGVGAASMITPLYTSENAPRAIRGALTGMYQFFIVTGVCIAFWINYGSLLHSSGTRQYVVPLAMQGLPALLLFFGMLFSSETYVFPPSYLPAHRADEMIIIDLVGSPAPTAGKKPPPSSRAFATSPPRMSMSKLS